MFEPLWASTCRSRRAVRELPGAVLEDERGKPGFDRAYLWLHACGDRRRAVFANMESLKVERHAAQRRQGRHSACRHVHAGRHYDRGLHPTHRSATQLRRHSFCSLPGESRRRLACRRRATLTTGENTMTTTTTAAISATATPARTRRDRGVAPHARRWLPPFPRKASIECSGLTYPGPPGLGRTASWLAGGLFVSPVASWTRVSSWARQYYRHLLSSPAPL